jgi:hypothetical protein
VPAPGAVRHHVLAVALVVHLVGGDEFFDHRLDGVFEIPRSSSFRRSSPEE